MHYAHTRTVVRYSRIVFTASGGEAALSGVMMAPVPHERGNQIRQNLEAFSKLPSNKHWQRAGSKRGGGALPTASWTQFDPVPHRFASTFPAFLEVLGIHDKP
jgi:hypothetical protein